MAPDTGGAETRGCPFSTDDVVAGSMSDRTVLSELLTPVHAQLGRMEPSNNDYIIPPRARDCAERKILSVPSTKVTHCSSILSALENASTLFLMSGLST